jgi:hypothetical protein
MRDTENCVFLEGGVPESWEDIHLRDLFYAFRKAKADRFYETSIRSAEKFIAYEDDLAANLQQLLVYLQNGEIGQVISSSPPSVTVLPKKTGFAPSQQKTHVHWSSFARERQSWSKGSQIPEFRFVGDFSVDHHILSALWINLIGHKFDAALGKSAIASRLRRYQGQGQHSLGEYHLDAIGSFEPYYGPYKDWRDGGLKALKDALNDERDVAAITLDVTDFYHSIDPTFAIHSKFLEENRICLDAWETEFTEAILSLIANWRGTCEDLMKRVGCSEGKKSSTGFPIGLSVSRLLSNVFLHSLDREFERNLSPIYYSRYVDDIFLVISDHSKFKDQIDLVRFISEKVPSIEIEADSQSLIYKNPPWGGQSKIRFGSEKQKVFFLSGAAGLDLLANISEQIKSVSSERRLMPSVDDIDRLSSAKVLASGSSPSDEVDALRKADGLTLRRLGWSILLRSLSVLARDLNPDDWVDARKNVYRFAYDHVIRADKILEYLDKIPWLFSIAISVQDYPQARDILFRTRESLSHIRDASGENLRVNGCQGKNVSNLIWEETGEAITKFFREALIRSYENLFQDTNRKSLRAIMNDLDLSPEELEEKALCAISFDWGRVPYRYAQETHVRRAAKPDEEIIYSLYPRTPDLEEFMEKRDPIWRVRLDRNRPEVGSKDNPESLLSYLFPTRPYLAEEVALATAKQCVFEEQLTAARNWSRYVRALRGIWTKPDELADLPVHQDKGLPSSVSPNNGHSTLGAGGSVNLGGEVDDKPILLGVSSFATPLETWNIGANGSNDLSPTRYNAIRRLVNQAITTNPRPDYLILPELALPERWIGTVSQLLRQSGISLIAGVDYSYPSKNEIYSSAVLALRDDRLGYPSTIQVRQPKCVPAPHEDQELRQTFGRSWSKFDFAPKPIYEHFGFHFNVLVCSELSNIEYRKHAQGKVDSLFVLSWNQDLETFSALTESSALDIHCYVSLCNNRTFGDSRVRAPMKNSWERDICRLRGGLNDHLAVVKIDVAALRRHQSKATPWPKGDDKFKPVPEGFQISDKRRVIPA